MKAVKLFFLFILSLAFWAVISAVLGNVFLSVVPCDWFGSSFEGACGYRAMWFTFLVCAIFTIVFSFGTVIGYARRKDEP